LVFVENYMKWKINAAFGGLGSLKIEVIEIDDRNPG
jgi:hypothetical protein